MRIAVRIQRSPSLAVAVAVIGTLAAFAIAALPWSPLLKGATLLLVVALTARALRQALQAADDLLELDDQHRLRLTAASRQTQEAVVSAATVVTPAFVSLVYRDGVSPAGWRRFAPAPSRLILPDMMSADDYRRLCLLLRWGGAHAGPAPVDAPIDATPR